jgi:eukaryotic-like serine/threonine-protein kinase
LKKLGKYEVLGEIGHGAMGVVYRARDPFINRLVALKTITTGVADDPALLERFYREAQSAGGLQHPNIVTIYDMGDEGHVPYIAMELVEGENLEQVIARRAPLSISLKLVYAMQACRAFDYAHKRGIVHRDIKPGNVMVSKDGSVRVVDFGIARVLETSKTQTGMLIGTFAYMSPEQYHGEHADERSDIWSFGVLVYELLTFQRPFTGATPASLMHSICQQDPAPLSAILADCPNELELIVSKLLKKSPAERYQSMEDVLLELEPVSRRLQSLAVAELIEQANELIEKSEFAQGRELLRQALQVESGNQKARVLLEKANVELKRIAVRPKVQECIERVRALLDEGKIQEAKLAVENALHLDSTYKPAQELQRVVELEIDRARRVAEWVDAAKQYLAEGLPDEAEALVAKALEAEPSNPQAAALNQLVVREKAERQRRLQLLESLQHARNLWTKQEYTECIEFLSGLEKNFPGEEEVTRLLETVREDHLEQQKQQGLLEFRNLLAARRHDECLTLLLNLQKRLPRDEEIPRLLEDVRRDQRNHQRLQGLADAKSALAAGQYDACKSLLSSLGREFPDEPEIPRLLETAERDQKEQRRQQGMAVARKLLVERSYEESISSLLELRQQFPADEEIVRLLDAVRWEQAEQRKQEGLGQARKLLESRNYAKLSELLTSLQREFPEEGEIRRLQKSAEDEQAEQRKQEGLGQARKLLESRSYAKLSELLTALQREFPEEGEIRRLQKSAEDEQAEQRKQEGLGQARKLLESRSYAKLSELLTALQKEFPEEGEIRRLRKSADDEQAQQRKQEGLGRAWKLLESRNYEKLYELLASLQKEFPEEGEIQRLQKSAQDQQAEQRKQEGLGRARKLLESRSYEKLYELLASLQKEFPEEGEIHRLQKSAQDEQAKQRKEESLGRARKLLESRNYEKLTELLASLQKEFPDEAEIPRLRRSAQEEQAEQHKRESLATARKLLAAQRYDESIEVLSQLQAEFVGDPEINKLIEGARVDRAERRKQQKLAEARAHLAAQSFRKALASLEDLTESHPNDAAVLKLRALVQREEEKHAKAERVQRELEFLKKLTSEKKYPEVLSRTKQLLAEFPGETNFTRLAEFASSQQANIEKDNLLRKTLDDAKALFVSGRFEELIGVTQAGLKTFPANPELLNLYQQGEIQQRKLQIRQQIEQRVREIRVKINREKFSEAIDLAQETLVKLGPDTDLSQLLNSAQVEFEARERKRKQERSLETIRTFIESEDLSAAARTIDEVCDAKILDSFDPRIQRLSEQVEDAKTRAEQKTSPTPTPIPPNVSREYALLQSAPPREAPVVPERVSAPDASAPQASASQPTLAPAPLAPAVPPRVMPASPVSKPQPPEPVAVGAAKESFSPVEISPVRVETPESLRPKSKAATSQILEPVPATNWRKLAAIAVSALALLLITWAGVVSIRTKPTPVSPSPKTSTEPAAPRVDPLELQQRDALNEADKLVASNDLDGALQKLQQAAALNGPLTSEIQKKQSVIDESLKDESLRRLRQREEVLWQAAMNRLADGRYVQAQKGLHDILNLPVGGSHRDEAQNYLDKVIPQRMQQSRSIAIGRQSLEQGDFPSARRAADQLKQQGGDPAPLLTEIDRAEQSRLAQLESQFNQFKQRDDEAAVQQLKLLQPKFQSLASDGGTQSGEALNYANSIPSAIADVQARAQKKIADAGFQQMVQRYQQAAGANDKNGLTAARTDFEAVIQGGGPHAEEAQKHLLDINNKLATLNQPVVSEPKPPVKPESPAVVTVDNDAAVRAVIQKYVQAFDQKDADALRQIWPNMGPLYARLKRAFEGASSIREQLDIESVDLSPDGTKAVVKGQITQDFTPKGDKTKRVKNATVFHLAKSNSGTWVITDVQ